MNDLKKKLKKQGGFTLVEMLIVVAIIAILIMVSIPMVGTALEGSRHAVDQANVRDAISLAAVEFLTKQDSIQKMTADPVYTYNVNDTTHQGELVAKAGGNATLSGTAVTPKCQCGGAKTTALEVTINRTTGAATVNWTCTENGTTVAGG